VSEGDAALFPPGALEKYDSGDDEAFYAEARLVTHIDDTAIETLTDFYRTVLPSGGVLLDLMSSWVSHLPPDIAYRAVIGHGMNAAELAANPRLMRWFTQDLNRDPALPPVSVLKELARVMRPGAPLVISYSNRCFPTKAVAVWHALDNQRRADLVSYYLKHAGFADIAVHRLIEEDCPSDPMTAVVGRTNISS
jgi:SAM-dependent methyltransferase